MNIFNIKNGIIVFHIAVLLTLGGCNKFLDIKPKGKDVPQSIAHYDGLFNNNGLLGFTNFKYELDGSMWILGSMDLQMYMSDDVESFEPYFSNMELSQQRAFKWEPNLYLPDEDASEWGAPYVANYIFNLVANKVMDAEDGTIEQKKALLAEARVSRAYMHFIAANLFAKPYDAATAATDPGVPIVTEASTGNTYYERSSVKEVYDFILKEMTESVPDLELRAKSRVRIYKPAGFYLLGQVYLYMHDYEKALEQFKLAFEHLAQSDVTLALYDYNSTVETWYNPASPHTGLNAPLQFYSDEVIFVKQCTAPISNTFGNYLYLKPEIYDLFGPTDHRKKIYSNYDFSSGTNLLPGYKRTRPYVVNYGPALPNLYLMLAECKARLGDIDGARTDLETLRKNRMPVEDASVTANTRESMVKAVLDERLREFASSGLRWFDMRRLSSDPEFNNVSTTHKIGSEIFTLTPERMVLKIPPKILSYSPNLQNNP